MLLNFSLALFLVLGHANLVLTETNDGFLFAIDEASKLLLFSGIVLENAEAMLLVEFPTAIVVGTVDPYELANSMLQVLEEFTFVGLSFLLVVLGVDQLAFALHLTV